MDGSGFLDGMPCPTPFSSYTNLSLSMKAFQVCLALTYHTHTFKHTKVDACVNIGAALNFLNDFLTDFY